MTGDQARPAVVELVETRTSAGCTHCGTSDTVQLHPHRGRLCPDAIVLPPGAFQPDLAADMVDLGRADAAFAYLGAWLRAECDRRFDAARLAVGGLTVGRLTAGVITADIVISGPITAAARS